MLHGRTLGMLDSVLSSMLDSHAMKTADAIEHFGGVTALARALEIRRVAVYQWGEYPPSGRQYELEVLTSGALRAEPRPGSEKGSRPLAEDR